MALSSLTFRPLSVDISFHEISHSVIVNNAPKVILNKASGHFEHGRLHAIMGPSGSGKSSLLNVLAGFNPVANGAVSFNGVEYPVSKWSPLITPARSYILQDDFLVPELTVKEQIMYSVDLKVPSETSTKAKSAMVETIISLVRLEDLTNRSIKVLSGGQRKRLCVASELANYPPVLFLDEPTTGLDSTSCYRLVDLLKSLAQCGCNVIATIHQPNSRVFAMFDTVTVLGEGGVIAYSGPSSFLADVMETLLKVSLPKHQNPAEFLFEPGVISKLASVSNRLRQKAILQAAKNIQPVSSIQPIKSFARLEGDVREVLQVSKNPESSRREGAIVIKPKSKEEVKAYCETSLPSHGARFLGLFRRTLVQSRRDIVFMVGRVLAYAVILIFGIVYQGVGSDRAQVLANLGFLFMYSLAFTCGPAIVTMMTLHSYLNVLIREQVNSLYGVSAFYACRTIVDVAMNILIGCTYPLALWLMTGQPQENFPVLVILMCLYSLQGIASHHFAYLVALFVDPSATSQLPFAVIMIHMLFCGYLVPVKLLPGWISWLRFINSGPFVYTATMKLVYGEVVEGHRVEIPCKQAKNPLCNRYRDGNHVLETWSIDIDLYSYWTDIFAIAAYAVGFAVLGNILTVVYVKRAKRAIARL